MKKRPGLAHFFKKMLTIWTKIVLPKHVAKDIEKGKKRDRNVWKRDRRM